MLPLHLGRSREMIRSAVSKLMWVGRATVFLEGLAVILAVVFGVVSVAAPPWWLPRWASLPRRVPRHKKSK
jgi:hypothetical protein